jgi:hypothetical protein
MLIVSGDFADVLHGLFRLDEERICGLDPREAAIRCGIRPHERPDVRGATQRPG